MMEPDIFGAGLRHLHKISELDHQLEAIAGLRYKVDSNNDLVYLELDEHTLNVRERRAIFLSLAIPPELWPKSKMEPLGV
jgi:hypothetical protein